MPQKGNDEALKEIAGNLLQMSNRALEKMTEQEGPIGEAAEMELERREILGEVLQMDEAALDTAARGSEPRRAELANREIVRRRAEKAKERAEEATTVVRDLVLELDLEIVRLLRQRADHFSQLLGARHGAGVPLHPGVVTTAIADAFAGAAAGEGIDPGLSRTVAQAMNGVCRRYAESQLTEG